MATQIVVSNGRSGDSVSIIEFEFEHLGCGPMRSRRDVVNPIYELRCDCGLALDIPSSGSALDMIVKTAVDADSRMLPPGSFRVTPAGAIEVMHTRLL